MACLNEVCRNPCTALTPCGINAECTVQNTLPQRTMMCMCRPGYVGDADVACNLRKYSLLFYGVKISKFYLAGELVDFLAGELVFFLVGSSVDLLIINQMHRS